MSLVCLQFKAPRLPFRLLTSKISAHRERSTSAVIAYLALTGSLLALGIDIVIPAFDEMRPDLGLEPGYHRGVAQLFCLPMRLERNLVAG